MGLSRKHKRELKRLKHSAADLWGDQKEVLEQASKVVREAGKQVKSLSRDEVAPRVRGKVASGVAATRSAADTARDKLAHDVFPSVASALASAMAVIEVAKDVRVKEAMRQVKKAGEKVGTRTGIVQPKRGPGRYILLGLGVVAVAGAAYAAWQTLRDDDDLWISDEFDTFEKQSELDSL